MKAVSNSSVLIALANLERLDLIQRRFPEGIRVPRAVWREVVETGQGKPGAKRIAAAPWIEVSDCAPKPILDILKADLDEGESEAIALAIETDAKIILLDEKSARQTARRMKLPVLGTVGLLVWAKQHREIPMLKPELDLLIQQSGFRIGPEVYQLALQSVGE